MSGFLAFFSDLLFFLKEENPNLSQSILKQDKQQQQQKKL